MSGPAPENEIAHSYPFVILFQILLIQYGVHQNAHSKAKFQAKLERRWFIADLNQGRN
jgi:hypothetical protein